MKCLYCKSNSVISESKEIPLSEIIFKNKKENQNYICIECGKKF